VINLLEQKTDVAIRVGTLPDSALIARKLGQSHRIACASPAYLEKYGTPTTPADLQRHNCILFNFRRSASAGHSAMETPIRTDCFRQYVGQ